MTHAHIIAEAFFYFVVRSLLITSSCEHAQYFGPSERLIKLFSTLRNAAKF